MLIDKLTIILLFAHAFFTVESKLLRFIIASAIVFNIFAAIAIVTAQ